MTMSRQAWFLIVAFIAVASYAQSPPSTPPPLVADFGTVEVEAVGGSVVVGTPSPLVQAGISTATSIAPTTTTSPPPPNAPQVAVADTAVVGSVAVAAGGAGTPGDIITGGVVVGSPPSGPVSSTTTTGGPSSAALNTDDASKDNVGIGIGAACGVAVIVIVAVAIGLYVMRTRTPAKNINSDACLEMIPHHDPVAATRTWNPSPPEQQNDVNAVEL